MAVNLHLNAAVLYTAIGVKYPRQKLDYGATLEFCSSLGTIKTKHVCVRQLAREAAGFIYMLKKIGYTVSYMPFHSLDCAFALEVLLSIGPEDTVILGTSDVAMRPLTTWLLAQGHRVIILGCDIPAANLLPRTSAIEIPPSLLEVTNEKQNP